MLRMLKHLIVDATNILFVKRIGDQDIAQDNPVLAYNGYVEWFLLHVPLTIRIILSDENRNALYIHLNFLMTINIIHLMIL
jgi:hypothetical protein